MSKQERKYDMSDVPVCEACGRLDFKRRGQRELDALAYAVLAGQHRGPDSWTHWSDWLELTKARRGEQGLGTTTFTDSIRRLIARDKVRMRAVGKNTLYQSVFFGVGEPSSPQPAPRSSRVALPKRENGYSQESSVVLDKGQMALQHLLNRKPPSVL